MKKAAIIFPGQGSQFVGMGREFIETDNEARDLIGLAAETSGIDLKRLCLEGPLKELTSAKNLQPAITAINMICWQQFTKRLPDFKPAFFMGHSLGECSALYAAGVLGIKETLSLVAKRGSLVEREGTTNPGGMKAVLGLTVELVENTILQYSSSDRVVVANHNSEQQIVISGDNEGLEGVGRICKELGGRVIPLKVSVANHSPLIAGAVDEYREFMEEISFKRPGIPVMFNYSAAVESDPERIKTLIAKQITNRVRWFESVRNMVDEGVKLFVELGPKTVLTNIAKSIVKEDHDVECMQADTPEALEKVVTHILS